MTAKPFVLSVKVIVRGPHGRCLLLRRSAASKNNAGKWEFPGGKIDPGETFDTALIREVREETGLDIRLSHVVGTTESQLPDRTVAYLILEANTGTAEVRLSTEHSEFAWIAAAALPAMDLAPQFRAVAQQYSQKETTSARP